MSRPATEQQQRNRVQQARLYGAPLGDLLAEVAGVLGVTQGRIARLLGLSAPMVSQLATGHRVKIGNPGAVARLQRLIALTADVRDGRSGAAEALEALERDTSDEHLLTRSSRAVSGRQGAQAVQQVLRAVASEAEVRRVADELAARHPALAELLRVYGTGTEEEAAGHFTRATGG